MNEVFIADFLNNYRINSNTYFNITKDIKEK